MLSLVLSYFDLLYGPTILIKTPFQYETELLQDLIKLMDMQKTIFFSYNYHPLFTINHSFTIPNIEVRGKNDFYLISIISDELIARTDVFKGILEGFISKYTRFMTTNHLTLQTISDYLKSNEEKTNNCNTPEISLKVQFEHFFSEYLQIITPLVHELNQLENEKQNLIKFPEENPNPVMRIGKDLKIQYINKPSYTLFNLPSTNGSPITPFMIQIPPKFIDAIETAFTTKKIFQFHHNTNDRTFFITVTPNINEKYLNLYALDITSQIKFQTELQDSKEELKNLNSTLLQIFKASMDGIRIIDMNFNIIDVNDAFIQIVGLPRDQIIGKKCYEVFPGLGCHSDKCTLRQILQRNDKIQISEQKTLANGDIVESLISGSPITNSKGEIISIVEFIRIQKIL